MKLLAVLLVALVTLIGARSQVQAYECVKPWQKVSDDVCLLLNSGIKSWNHANFLCKFYESDLLFIQNEAEGKALTNYLNNLIRYRFNQKSYLWLDAKKNTDTNQWQWTRNNQTVNYSNWNLHARPDEARSTLNCACFKLKDGTWKDCDCETTNHFVCRKSNKPATNQTLTAPSTPNKVETTVESVKPVAVDAPAAKTNEGVQAQINLNIQNASIFSPIEPQVNEQAKIALPQVIDEAPKVAAVPEKTLEPLKVVSSPSVPVLAQLPPKLPAPIVINPVVVQAQQPLVVEEKVEPVEPIANPAAIVQQEDSAKIVPNADALEILPIQTVENILTPKTIASPTARIIGNARLIDEVSSSRGEEDTLSKAPILNSDDIQSILSTLEVKPDTVLNSNSLPTIDQVRDVIRPQIESEISSSRLNNPTISGLSPQPFVESKPVRDNVVEMYLPLTEIDPQQFFDFTSKSQEDVPVRKSQEPTSSIVEQDQLPAANLDYNLIDGPVVPRIIGSPQPVNEFNDQLPQEPTVQEEPTIMTSNEAFSETSPKFIETERPVMSALDELDPRDFIDSQRPRMFQPQQTGVPRILLSSSDPNVQKDMRVDGGALKLLRLLRPRNRFYRLKPEMLIEETPNMIRTLSGKTKPVNENGTKVDVEAVPAGVDPKNIRKVSSEEEANRNMTVRVRTNELTNEDKNIIISSKVMIDEEEKKDKNQNSKSAYELQKENEKLITLLSEQSFKDPGKVMIRTSISKSTETFRLFECPNGYGYYSISNTNCNKYKRCDDWDLRNAVLTINKCSEGKVFSFTKLTCVNPSEYICEDKVDKFVSFEENF